MNNLELIRFKQIFTLLEILKNSNFLATNEIRRKYETYATNFDYTVGFLRKLGVIEISEGEIAVAGNNENILNQLADNEESKNALKESLSKKMFSENSFYINTIDELFSEMLRCNNEYTLKSPTPQHLVGLRNLLIEFGVIDFNYETQIYIVRETPLVKHLEHNRFFKLSKQELDEILKQRDLLGQDAELAVLQFEKEKLSVAPELINKIKHISPVDVGAGYDIESFKDAATKKPIFIEVKAVSLVDYEFKWSKNEMNCAKRFKDKYYLYLLPVATGRRFDFSQLKIIEDPFQKVFVDKQEWFCETEVLSTRQS